MGQPLQKQSEHRQVLDCLTKCLQCVCKEPSRDHPAAAPFRAVLSKVEGRKGREGKGLGKEGATRARLGRTRLIFGGSSVDTRKLCFFYSFPATLP